MILDTASATGATAMCVPRSIRGLFPTTLTSAGRPRCRIDRVPRSADVRRGQLGSGRPFWRPRRDSTIIDYQDTYRIAGTLTRFVGNHTLKLGAEYTLDKFNYAQTNTSSGIWYFGGGPTASSSIGANAASTSGLDIASYLLGYANSGGPWYDDLTASEIKYPAVFLTDDWRATTKLTFHLGARWERVGPFSERHDRISWFSPTATNDVLTAAGIPGVAGNYSLVNTPERASRYGVNPDNMQFSPHVGVSYRLRPNTVINSGVGLFWLPNYLSTNGNSGWDASTGFSTPYVYSTNGYTPTSNMSQPFPLINGQPGIILPPGHNLTAFQDAELVTAPPLTSQTLPTPTPCSGTSVCNSSWERPSRLTLPMPAPMASTFPSITGVSQSPHFLTPTSWLTESTASWASALLTTRFPTRTKKPSQSAAPSTRQLIRADIR